MDQNKKIIDLMNYMEDKYNIPTFKKDVEEYVKNDVNKAVFDIYIKLADIREFEV